MSNGKVSVIVPVYNVEKYVAKCIESILAQTYTNLEILINNDGSTDDSYKICLEYAERDNRIHVFTQENSGVSICRNKMIGIASGEYIIFVDPDDWIVPNHIERLVSILIDNDADMSCCGYNIISNDKLRRKRKNRKNNVQVYTGKEFADLSTKIIGCRCYAWGHLIKKSVMEGFFFPEHRIFEDLTALPKLMLDLKRVAFTKEPLYIYRKRKEGQSHASFSMKRTDDELEAYICLTQYGIEHKFQPIFRNGVIFFILVYIRFKVAMTIRNLDQTKFNEKYRPYFKMYLRMFITHNYGNADLIFRHRKSLC